VEYFSSLLGLNMGAFEPAYRKPGVWLKSAAAPTVSINVWRLTADDYKRGKFDGI
jgi:hypothetical protein